MGLIELIVTVCALSLPSQCEDQHFSFLADMSLSQLRHECAALHRTVD